MEFRRVGTCNRTDMTDARTAHSLHSLLFCRLSSFVSHFSKFMSENNPSVTANPCRQPSLSQKESIVRIAIVGGGITGACVASVLASIHPSFAPFLEPQASNESKHWFATKNIVVEVHVFDQGRSGVGGRSSHRVAKNDEDTSKGQWDHGCQVRKRDHSFLFPMSY